MTCECNAVCSSKCACPKDIRCIHVVCETKRLLTKKYSMEDEKVCECADKAACSCVEAVAPEAPAEDKAEEAAE